jgi:hypothetical protein
LVARNGPHLSEERRELHRRIREDLGGGGASPRRRRRHLWPHSSRRDLTTISVSATSIAAIGSRPSAIGER